MRTLMLTTTAALALAGTAATAQSQLTQTVDNFLEANGFVIDADTLPQATIAELNAVRIDSNAMGGDTQEIENILRDAGYGMMTMGERTVFYRADLGANSLRDSVALKLQEFGYDVDTVTLTDEQVAEIYAIVNSTDGEPSRDRIEMVIQ